MSTINAAIMSARVVDEKFADAAKTKVPQLIVSADSHVDDPIDLWKHLSADEQSKLSKLVNWDNNKRPAGGLIRKFASSTWT